VASGQDSVKLTPQQAKTLAEYDKAAKVWLETLKKPGIKMDSTGIYYDEEAKKIMSDQKYRDSIYRQPYTMRDVALTLTAGDLRLAFYQMINLYPTNQAKILQYITAYDQAIEADKIVNSAFYTYALLDPRITKIVDGKPDIYRPDIMEELFHYANEISAYVLTERAKKKKR